MAHKPHDDRIAAAVRAEVARTRTTQSALAEALGLNQAQISRRLNGAVPFSGSELVVAAAALGVDPRTFLPVVERAS